MLNDITTWLNVRDYDAATETATDRIVKKQSRGSIFAQNGWYMTRAELMKNSHAADRQIARVRSLIRKAS